MTTFDKFLPYMRPKSTAASGDGASECEANLQHNRDVLGRPMIRRSRVEKDDQQLMIICEKHGCQTGAHVSPDLADHINSGRPVPPFRQITYCCHGPFWENLLSETFAAENGADEMGDVDLPPDDYPAWFTKLVPMCGRCVEDAIGRPIRAK